MAIMLFKTVFLIFNSLQGKSSSLQLESVELSTSQQELGKILAATICLEDKALNTFT